MAQSRIQPMLYDPRICELTKFWFHVFVVNDTDDIRGIVIDDERLEAMKKLKVDMKVHYNTEESDEEMIVPGRYYAVFDEEWHRVQCSKCDYIQGTASVLFIDRGDEDILPFANFLPLHTKFCSLPAQSVRLSIDGLALFQDCVAMQSLMEDLLIDSDVLVNVLKCKKSTSEVPILLTELTIVNETDDSDTIAVRDFLQHEILQQIANPLKNIDNDDLFQKVHISHLSQKSVFVQVRFEGLKYLNKLLDQISRGFLDTECYKHKPVASIDKSKVYLFKNRDHKWYRVKVTNLGSSDVRVKFIDVGSEVLIDLVQLVPLEGSSSFLSRYPEQAIEVKLHKIPSVLFDEGMIAYLRHLVSNYEFLYMRTVGVYQNMPIAQFYQRDSRNNLILINAALVIEILLRQHPPEISGCYPLKIPKIPEKDLCFDVQVILVAHPESVVVQPLCSAGQLQNMMADLSDICKSFTGPSLSPACIEVGEIYAALNSEDKTWYRGYVYKVFDRTTFAVYACDYGDCFVASLKDLQPLQKKFYDLPFQAIRAKLVGIDQELMEKWTVYDSLQLDKFIALKDFVAVVKDQEIDPSVFGQFKVNLELIDTSANDDVYITDMINSRVGPWE